MKMFWLTCIFSLLLSSLAQAQSKTPPKTDQPSLEDNLRRDYNESFGDDLSPIVEQPEFVPTTSEEAREFSNIGLFYTYTPLAIILSGRHGGELIWIINKDWSLTGEYGQAKLSTSTFDVDLASFSETVYGVHARYFTGNSFNLQFGLGRREHELKVGSDLIPNGSRSVSASANVFHFAFGNRWQWANGFSLGFDWLVFDIPVSGAKTDDKDIADNIEDDEDRQAVKDAISAMRYFPTIGVARFALGFVF